MGYELTFDHFRPQSQAGTDEAANLVTTLGQIYIDRLQLNRSALIQNRLERHILSRIESHMTEITNILREIASKMENEKDQQQ